MTSLVAGGLFTAVAFAGAGFRFSHLNKSGYEAEKKRHNKALEQLAKEKEAWYEHTVEKANRIKELRQQLSDANSDFNDTNHALELLRKVHQEERRRFPIILQTVRVIMASLSLAPTRHQVQR